MSALLLALLLAQADGGVSDAGPADAGRFSAPLYEDCPVVTAATPLAFGSSTLDGGMDWFMPNPRGARLGCLLEACETDRRLKEQHLEDPKKFIAAFSTGLSIGVSLATGFFFVKDLLPRP